MTLLSTALQEYPDLRVVLLIDDPPNPRYAGPRHLLEQRDWRCQPKSSGCSPSRVIASTWRWSGFEFAVDPDDDTTAEDLSALAGEYEYATAWIRSLAQQYQVSDHNERFFTNHVLGQLASDLALTGRGTARGG